MKWFHRSIEFLPSHDGHYHLAMALALEGKFVASAAELTKAMSFSVMDADFRLLSTLLSACGLWVRLEAFLRRCIQGIW
jgi:hypothetical protein